MRGPYPLWITQNKTRPGGGFNAVRHMTLASGPAGNRTPITSMPWRRDTTILQAH